ncbi:FAD:protein FMN transferase [Coraliomargarita akajimensis]|nr:FAD:protein FMN transferase [Coraliomargarita akajimensis]
MGTRYQLTFLSIEGVSTVTLEQELEAIWDEMDAGLSTWNPDSWISRFNREAGQTQVHVPASVLPVIAAALDVAEQSSSALDPTVYLLLQAWGFGPGKAGRAIEPPDDRQVERHRELCSYTLLEFDIRSRLLSKRKAGVQIDCSAMAKGYAVDRIAQLLEASGIERYLIEIGGEIRLAGENQQGQLWAIGYQWPDVANVERSVLRLSDAAVATSGGSHVFKRQGDRVYTHLIDPRSGYPLSREHPVFSATVIGPECMWADALATAAFVLGPDALSGLKDAYPDYRYVFILKNGAVIER